MTTKRVRVLLAACLLLLLCGGCLGNCVTDFSDGLSRAMRGDTYGDYSGGYYYVVEADAGPSDGLADAGVE